MFWSFKSAPGTKTGANLIEERKKKRSGKKIFRLLLSMKKARPICHFSLFKATFVTLKWSSNLKMNSKSKRTIGGMEA